MKISQLFSSLTQTQSQTQTQGIASTKQSFGTTSNSTRTGDVQNNSRDARIANLLSKYHVEASEDELNDIRQFMDKAPGTETDKFNTLETALAKQIEPTTSNLMDLHSALNDAALTSEQIDTLAVPSTPTQSEIKSVISSLKLPGNVKAMLSKMVDQGYTLKEATTMLANAMGIKILADGNVMKAVINAMAKMTDEAISEILQKDIIKTTVKAGSAVTAPVIEVLTDPENAVYGTEAHQPDSGQVKVHEKDAKDTKDTKDTKDAAAPDDQDMKAPLIDADADSAQQDSFETMLMEAVNVVAANLESLTAELEIKQYLVTETTAMGIEMKAQFDAFKSDVTAVLAAPEAQNAETLASSVAKAIEMIDKTITQKEVTLYSTMQTERDLLVTSSELREASNLLAEGKVSEAVEIVSKAHDTVKNLFFNPDRRQVMLFVTQRAQSAQQVLEPNGQQQTGQKIQMILSQLQDEQGKHHARDVVETLRFMGNNHESEVVSSLEGKDHQNDHELIRTNVKEILLKMTKEESEQRTVNSSEKSLMNLAGQQMMNDQQQSGKRPFYFFNYPVSESDDVGEMKVYVTGQNRQSKIDWQNSELYFGMDLDTIGKTGIKISIHNGDVSIQVLNDHHETLTAVLETYAEDMTAAGFKQVTVQGGPYQDKKPSAVVETQTAASDQSVKEGKVDMKV